MGLYTHLPDDIEEVDVIIAGGGTAGCIIAARLSDANTNLSILVIEGGPNNHNMPIVIYPALFLSNLSPGSKTTLVYQGNKSPSTGDRDIYVPSGGVLGGGSSINFLNYSRAQGADFDSWNTPSWSAAELLPYLKKLETYHGPDARDVHGSDGPINVSRSRFRVAKFEDDFIGSAAEMGWAEKDDLQGLTDTVGVQRNFRYVSHEGKRQDSAHRYLHPRLQDGQHPNIHIVVESQVERVLFDNNRAVGVAYRRNPAFADESDKLRGGTRSVAARKMVILSCGGCGTPALLERSGVGNPEILKRAGIPLVADVPGVGNGYRDHSGFLYAYKSALGPTETMDALLRGSLDAKELIDRNDPLLGWTSMDVTSKLRPHEVDVAALGPAFQKHWDDNYKGIPDKPMTIMTPVNGFPGDPTGVPPGQYMGICTFSTYPLSDGYVHITGPRMNDRLDFETGFLADPHGIDLTKARWDYKTQRELMRRMKAYRGEWAPGHPPFAPGSKAACVDVASPRPERMDNIAYTAEDDAVIDQWLRENIQSVWHSQGTCKMAPRENGGVVDASLSVYGTEGLRVADLSMLPQPVGANTNNTALLVGEKAADIFIRELACDWK